ncbi:MULTISPECIES: alpha/beta hydrolase [unclassified Bradyrhizobium]|uniref:PHA/PHB synthase family protein n=1 Tax=unclassified Bradyrhizobium TaxID=2631580 RepID=UPI001BA61E23|nr:MULTISPECIES: alpha/beta fold hydrolase [unclassified Bradyrhizobium]MBR1205170.1 polyhydroxyalkanoic acid synthase [Bradyrhizobium sp. AUGA SZCCT0124]MBR1312249.1 polyhydroxyalkanoic acid synthase [Bradyrhizobium sp. AUGA SZCCT0051]MBR1342140.1 polyhydroxyalkanoic acid synthase [Bradyrhizobium sp. AUGA SZCCT0105]MBR1358931.1 polyhydroxyalkanoic acid synthase [Bradyrhizobium sp. AUGA SZCCT0045]
MNAQTGTALLHGDAIETVSSLVIPPVERAADRASLTREAFRDLDRATAAAMARITGGLSPAALWLAYSDWAMHLGAAPGKQLELALDLWQDWTRLFGEAMQPAADHQSERSLQDDRFRGDAWQQFPYRLWYENFLLTEQWWRKATRDVAGVSPHHADVVTFAARQWLDMFSPSNLPWTNPEVAQETFRTGGRNLLAGFVNWSDDVRRVLAKRPPAGTEAFKVGKNLATTPGQVVFRNHLIELIQYAPATATVHPEPVLIVPAWIMKYYILDLSPKNSLIGYLVSQGHTVFCISWRNVTADDRDVSLEDYRRLGVMAALDTIASIVPGKQVHAAGYCLGGTLLALAGAAMAETRDHRLKTMTLLAAQTDFSEPGELDLFIDDSQVSFLESMMWKNGTLDATQMAGAFQLLNSNDLIWSRLIREYLMGARAPMIDLMAWNADTTRMPFRMHSDYLRKLFLGNDLASGRYVVDGHAIAIQNIRVPIFAVGTERDHVAPWHSVYKIHYFSDTEVTFTLTSGGHNAGIVTEPGHPHRHFRIASKAATDPCLSADEWVAATPTQQGSWWPAWTAWLAGRSSSPKISPPAMGIGIGSTPQTDAPGTYVLQP